METDERIILILLFIILEIILVRNGVMSEWIELPQFSNQVKVYRIPNIQKSSRKHVENAIIHTLSSKAENKHKKLNNGIKTPYVSKEANISSLIQNISRNYSKDSHFSTTMLTISPNNSTSTEYFSVLFAKNDDNILYLNTNFAQESPSVLTKSEGITKQELSDQYFIFHLPLQLFNTAHNILLKRYSQNSIGKYKFLNKFNKILLKKIELIVKPIEIFRRKKRDSSSENYDHHIGFPSLEGALLAISFLTFSVYLIQLVMMLLKNIANNNISTSAVLVNRNRRSIYQLNNTIGICEFLNDCTRDN